MNKEEIMAFRKMLRPLSKQQFDQACSQPDPYRAGLCTALELQYVPEGQEPPVTANKANISVRWQVGRALKRILENNEGLSYRAVMRKLRWSTDALYGSLRVFSNYPDGIIDAKSVTEAIGWRKSNNGNKSNNKGTRKQPGSTTMGQSSPAGGIDAALKDLKALAKQKGLPLKAEEITEVAAKWRVNPIVLQGAWGNAVLRDGAPTSEEIIAALQQELAARGAQFQTIMAELVAKDQRLAAQQQQIQEMENRVETLENTTQELKQELSVIRDFGATISAFFRPAEDSVRSKTTKVVPIAQ